MDYSRNYLNAFAKGLQSPICEVNGTSISESMFLSELLNITEKTRNEKGRIFFFGNGASASFANHMSLDWSKNGGVLALSLSDSSLLTALANDYSYEDAFKEFAKINAIGKGDLVATISSSGNSPNVVSVLDYANEIGAATFALSGLKPGNKSRNKAKFSVYYPFKTYGMVECAHQVYLHLWLDAFMNIFEWDREETQNMNIKEFKL
jgi:D-sedoheptulose 7-phosphate isomerase